MSRDAVNRRRSARSRGCRPRPPPSRRSPDHPWQRGSPCSRCGPSTRRPSERAGRHQLDVLAVVRLQRAGRRSRSPRSGRARSPRRRERGVVDLRDVDDVAQRERGVAARRVGLRREVGGDRVGVGGERRDGERRRQRVPSSDSVHVSSTLTGPLSVSVCVVAVPVEALPSGVMLARRRERVVRRVLAREVDDRALGDGVVVVARQRAGELGRGGRASTSRWSR